LGDGRFPVKTFLPSSPARRPGQPDPIKTALSEVRAVYEELARRPLERQCVGRAECCQFKLTGLLPSLTRAEALLAARAFRATGRKSLPERADGSCPMLDPVSSRCLIYADRPFGCRTHYCRAAGGPWQRRDVLDLIRRLEAADALLGHRDGPRPLPAALAAEMAR
jgi:Fe-S-cluster containining protein